jgi:hypothetical protein
MPRRPVATFEQPLLTTIARSRPLRMWSRPTMTGAPQKRFEGRRRRESLWAL